MAQKNIAKKPKILKSKMYKKRYILLEVSGCESLSDKDLFYAVLNNFLKFYGKTGCSERKLSVLICVKGRVLLRCSNNFLSEIKASIGKFDHYGGKKGKAKVLRVSGTIKKLKKQYPSINEKRFDRNHL